MSDYHSTDSHTFREWDARQEALRERLERMREYLPEMEGNDLPEEGPGRIRMDEPFSVRIGSRPYLWSGFKAEIRGGRYHEKARREGGERIPGGNYTWMEMRGDPAWLGRLLIKATEYYLKEMERREPQEAAS